MKVRIVILLVLELILSDGIAQSKFNMDQVINFKTKEITWVDMAETMQSRGIEVAYSREYFKENATVSLPQNPISLKVLLQHIQNNTGFNYRISANKLLFVKKQGKAGTYTLRGTITDAQSGETLIGANIFIEESGTGITTNYYGRYSLPLKCGSYKLQVSFIGYQTLKIDVYLNEDAVKDFQLEPKLEGIKEVKVTAQNVGKLLSTSDGNGFKMSVKGIREIPTVMGEPDVLQSLQILPGVNSAHEGTTNLSVRGGSFDQNLILLDEASIYNPSHTLGLFSVVNSDALKNVEFYKGYIPARYGGRLSSVVDMRMREGNSKKLGVDATLGLMASRLSVEGPIKKEKASFLVTGRYSYAGQIANLYSAFSDVSGQNEVGEQFQTGNKVSFYDLNAKFNYKVNENNHLFFSAYKGQDKFYYRVLSDDMSMDWGNTTSTLRWNNVISNRLFANHSLIYSRYEYSYYLLDDSRYYEWSAGLSEYKVKSDFDWSVKENRHVKFGGEYEYLNFDPGSVNPRTPESNTTSVNLPHNKASLYALYYEDKLALSDILDIQLGLRFSGMHSVLSGEQKSKSYKMLEPRLALGLQPTKKDRLSLSYGRTAQYLHLISNSSLGLPTDVWMVSSKNIKPQYADQISMLYNHQFDNKPIELEVQAYYKWLYNVVDFKDNADLFLNKNIEDEMLAGEARAYGIEVLIKKQFGRWQGFGSYTWSKAERTIEGINDGNPYPARYDRRHSVKLNSSYRINDRWKFSSNFAYSSGAPTTVPVGRYTYYDASFVQYSDRNSYRLPAYHRLDFLFTYQKKSEKNGWLHEWNLGVYNAYGRKNVYSLYLEADKYNLNIQNAKKVYLFTYVPTISYRVKF
ncbi:MAG: TonB-dependent receptor [Carboxylicivirga sp.]|jgi:hypothetical protein|nr:TonB-dependent receptor [Carboxylicivirga sp.]